MRSLNNRIRSSVCLSGVSLSGGLKSLMLDPGSIRSLFHDGSGSTPVTAAGQPVGLMRDVGNFAIDARQVVSAARPTYRVDASGLPYLEFDGVDDWLTTDNIPMAGGGHTIITAIRKRSDVATGAILETRPMWTSTFGGFAQFAPSASGPATYGSRILTSAAQSLVNTPASFAAPHVAVLSSVVGPGSHVVRVNGVQVASDAPGGNIPALTAELGIGSRNGTGFFARIDLYGLMIVDRTLNPQDLLRAERWAAAKCGVVL